MLGLDRAGKTAILYKLKLGETTTPTQTVGFNFESIQHKKRQFVIYDVGGHEKIRPIWRYYYQNTDAIIFVVDSSDRERIDDSKGYEESAKVELHRLFDEQELNGAPLLVFANKQDDSNSMTVEEMKKKAES